MTRPVADVLPDVAEQLRHPAEVAAALAAREGARFAVLGPSREVLSRCGCPPSAGGPEAR